MKEWMVGLAVILIVFAVLTGMISREEFNDIPSGHSAITGHFVRPAAREYGGAIRGVGVSYARAFPGMAVEVPSFDCYVCVCPGFDYGVSASSLESVQRACTGRCG